MEPLALWRVWTQLIVVAAAFGLCAVWPFPILRIVCCCIALAVSYAILQDQLTARLCPEYFTVVHPPIVGLTDPTLLGIAWGFLGSWWAGLFLGLALAAAMRFGSLPPLTLGELAWPIALLFMGVAGVTVLIGVGTHYNAGILGVTLSEPWASQVPLERHRAMLVVANAHFGTYGSALAGCLVACAWVVAKRRQCSG